MIQHARSSNESDVSHRILNHPREKAEAAWHINDTQAHGAPEHAGLTAREITMGSIDSQAELVNDDVRRQANPHTAAKSPCYNSLFSVA
jgi:hypothetical protein